VNEGGRLTLFAEAPRAGQLFNRDDAPVHAKS